MAVSYDFEGNILRMVLEGVYPPEAIMRAFDRALEDANFPDHARFLILAGGLFF